MEAAVAIPLRDVPLDEKVKLTVSERTVAALAPALETWLAGRAGAAGRPAVTGVRLPDTGGMSSTSVLFEADWGAGRHGAYVARMAPEASAVPVFPSYDLSAQFELISRVAAHCEIPLPALRWNEPEGGPLGTPFLQVSFVDGAESSWVSTAAV